MSHVVEDIVFQNEAFEQLKELSRKLVETVKRHDNEISRLKRQLVHIDNCLS